jgi:hypothetical protein
MVVVVVEVVVVADGAVVVVVGAGTQDISPLSHLSTTRFAHSERSLPPGGPHAAKIWSRHTFRLHTGGVLSVTSDAPDAHPFRPQASQQLA